MQSRNRNSFTAPAGSSPKDCERHENCICCQAVDRARDLAGWDCVPHWRSPLTPGVQGSNLSHDEGGRTLRVELGNDWPRMLRQLPSSGPGLTMTRNEAAILGRRMVYPHLEYVAGEGKGASAEGGLWVDFRKFGSARALHTRRETGHLFGVEFRDFEGCIVHRHTLSPEGDLDEFCGWVRLHQACPAHQPEWIEGVDIEGEEGELPIEPAEKASGAMIESLLSACGERKIWVRASVFTSGVIHRAILLPLSMQMMDGWWFVSDDDTGLHFRSELFSRVEIAHGASVEGRWPVLRARTAGHAPALVLEPADPGQLADWCALVRHLASADTAFFSQTE